MWKTKQNNCIQNAHYNECNADGFAYVMWLSTVWSNDLGAYVFYSILKSPLAFNGKND
jgi:hypothetical protein